ncbi:MAG: hypothetical protein IJV46_06545, partial [Acidaminococcaceae bacterium]|nr:hypothetical protein [Acidaminococcaceae bacterium]
TTKILKVNAEGIPEFLKAQPWWINWKPVFLDGKAKKLPTLGESVLRGQYWENAGRPFADALRTMPENGGVSLLLSLQNELACIDIDDCNASDARLQKIKQLAPDAWYELSPSGHGVHVWGILPDKRSYLLSGRKTIGYCGKDYEWYASGRGITVTGHAICDNAQKNLVDLTSAVKFCESLRPKTTEAPAVNNMLAANAPSVNFILQKAFDADPELQRMYYHGHSWDDKSREDFSFCRRLWFWLGGHGQQTIENIFEHSALYRKSKGPGYVSLTVRNAAKRWNGNYYGKGWVG